MIEQNGTRPNLPRRRGKTRRSLELIEAAHHFLEDAHPTTVRGVCYHLFIEGVIPSMATNETKRVSRLLTDAREEDWIPWEWIVDETRAIEKRPSWRDPAEFVEAVRRSYRRDHWAGQPHRVQVWSEKGTVRGVLAPVLEEYGVGFLAVHGFSSATKIREAADDYDGRTVHVLYVGDCDPSGLYMSEADLPGRLERYGGDHVVIERVALLPEDLADLPSFPAASKSRDARYRWFTERYGSRCWELDAMHPADLRLRVQEKIVRLIEPEPWERCRLTEEAEVESLSTLLDRWAPA